MPHEQVQIRGQLAEVSFPPATTWILGMELESSAMVAGTSTHWAILLASETKNLRFRSQDSPGFNSRSDWFAIKIDTNRGTHALSCLPPRLTQDWQDSPSFFLSLCLQLCMYPCFSCVVCLVMGEQKPIATSMSKASIMQYEALNMQPLYFLHKF